VGCHDRRLDAPPPPLNATPMALRRGPSRPTPWQGLTEPFDYVAMVQPVFDRHCVSCHDQGKEGGQALNLAGDAGLVFNTSYLELRTKSALRWFADSPGSPKLLVKAVDDGPPEVLAPYAWGSHRSRLVDVMRGEHYDVKLSGAELDRIVTWIDLNAGYYGSYDTQYPHNPFGRSPLSGQQVKRLAEITGVKLGTTESELAGNQVWFDRPALSPCLRGVKRDDPRYAEALAIIEAGAAELRRQSHGGVGE
jgi:hypothetical protein